MRLLFSLLALVVLTLPQHALAWGREGHVIVATIASKYLSDEASIGVQRLLALEPDPKNRTLVYASIWPDLIKSEKHSDYDKYRFARRLHYVNLPKDKDRYVKARDCPNSDCVVEAIRKYIGVLQNSNDPQARLVALKFATHFIADIHQPLHVGYKRDRGGNDVSVKFFHQRTNLHRVWDSMILRHDGASGKNLKQYAIMLGETITTEQRKSWTTDLAPSVWTSESRKFLQTHCYHLPSDYELDQDYHDHCVPVIHQQLQKAAIRLAVVLNKSFE